MMSFRRATFEGKRSRLFGPITAPVKDFVISEVMPRLLPLDWYRLHFWVVPDQRPEVFRIDLIETLEPVGDALRFAALKPLGQAIEQIIVRLKVPSRMRPLDLFATARAGQRTFKDVAKIKYIIAARQHRMGHVFVHLTETGQVVQVFACGMRERVEVMDQPWSRENPVLEPFVVVTILRISRQHPIVDCPRQPGPAGSLRRFAVKSVGSHAQAGNRNEDVVLAVSKGASRFWFVVIGEQAGLFDQLIAIAR